MTVRCHYNPYHQASLILFTNGQALGVGVAWTDVLPERRHDHSYGLPRGLGEIAQLAWDRDRRFVSAFTNLPRTMPCKDAAATSCTHVTLGTLNCNPYSWESKKKSVSERTNAQHLCLEVLGLAPTAAEAFRLLPRLLYFQPTRSDDDGEHVPGRIIEYYGDRSEADILAFTRRLDRQLFESPATAQSSNRKFIEGLVTEARTRQPSSEWVALLSAYNVMHVCAQRARAARFLLEAQN